MNQNYQPMPPVMGAQRPRAVRPWLLILFIIVLLAGAGFVWYFYYGPGKAAKTTTTPATTDPTASWKTYANKTYGYSIKYPPTETVNSTKPEDVTFSAPDNGRWMEEIKVSSTEEILDNIVSAKKSALEKETPGYTVTASDLQIDGKPAAKFSLKSKGEGGYGNIQIFVVNNSYLYEIDSDSTDKNFDNMLKTLKFITPTSATSTSTDLTYTNPDYGFTLTFPAAWKGYKFKEASLDGITMTYYVEVPTTDANATGDSTADAGYYSPFAIGVYTLAQWDVVAASEGPHDTLITKNDTYAFGWSQANGVPPSDFTKAMQDQIKTIIDSFKLT